MRLTRTFKVSGLVTVAGVLLHQLAKAWPAVPRGFAVLGGIAAFLGGIVFAVSLFRLVTRRLLWPVGSRLLVSYLLIGLLPIVLLIGLGSAAAAILTGQLAARRAEAALARRETALRALAEDLAPQLVAAAAEERRQLVAEEAEKHPELPQMGWAILAGGKVVDASPELSRIALAPDDTEGSGFGRSPDTLSLLAWATERDQLVALAVPFRTALAPSLAQETGIEAQALSGVLVKSHKPKQTNKPQISVKEGPDLAHMEFDAQKDGAPRDSAPAVARRGVETAALDKLAAGTDLLTRPWLVWFLALDRAVYDLDTGARNTKTRLVLQVKTSLAGEYRALFGRERWGTTSESEMGRIVYQMLRILSIAIGVVYLLATALASLLVYRIARATRRLSTGFAAIDHGDFAHRLALKGDDQLASLVRSFNAMAAHLETGVAERARQEALERELTLARDLQRNLLPPADLSFPRAEIAIDFRPAAAIGGDFYDLLVDGPATLTVVLADVSGHGLPTGIVMASAKASLSALAGTGLTGAQLLEALDSEIRRATGERTFVTMAHLVFRFDERRVEFTNAGHLYPYRLPQGGGVEPLANPSRPLGTVLPGGFRTIAAPLETGDLWVVLSDGIVEALGPSGEQFGFERLEAVLAAGTTLSATELREKILQAWRGFTGNDEPSDDRTLVVLRALGPAAAPAPPSDAGRTSGGSLPSGG